jgi:hypothetical protein
MRKPKTPATIRRDHKREQESVEKCRKALAAYKRARRWERLAHLCGIGLVLAWGTATAAAAIIYLINAGGAR